jgi:hypothetical protein
VVHDAPGSYKLLPGDTLTAVCESCHDGTGVWGVYGTIAGRGATVAASHSCDTTNVIPGGDYNTGGAAVGSFDGVDGRLSCGDCHSPHNTNVVAPYDGERSRFMDRDIPSGDSATTRLLRKRPTGATFDVDEYGSDWCLGCHKGRGIGPVHNHPVETTAVADHFYYDRVSRLETQGVFTTEIGSMGASRAADGSWQGNWGYVMPDPRTAEQVGHYPICQQCHEDARNVGDQVLGQLATLPKTEADHEYFNVWAYGVPYADGTVNNPLFLNFPHESVNPNFLLEVGDDLCLNCHNTELP